MIFSTTCFYCPFFYETKQGSGFAGVEDFCFCAAYLSAHFIGERCNAAHTLHAVKHQPLARKNGAQPSFNGDAGFPRRDFFSVTEMGFYVERGIVIRKDLVCKQKSQKNPSSFAHYFRCAL